MKSNSSREQRGNESKARHALDAGGDDDAELRGALPPAGADEDLAESQGEPEPTEEPSPKGLKRWGPWRRWDWYRKVRKQERGANTFWRDRDPREHARGRLPDDESVQVPAIWVAELYTPSTVGGLLTGIGDLGWEYGRSRDDSLTRWMNDVRGGRRAGWTSLGLVSPPEDAHFMSERTAPLPSGVKAALPILISLTPSLTALVIAFLFDDHSAGSLDSPLRAEFSTTIQRDPLFRPWHPVRYVLKNGSIRLGRRIRNPDLIRRETVRSRLRDLESGCAQWVRDHLPGAFVSLPSSRVPTATLLITERVGECQHSCRLKPSHYAALSSAVIS